MMDYRIREGVVLESICGIYVLISTEATHDKCMYIKKIDDIVAFYWEMMEMGLTVNEMTEKASEVFREVDTETLKNDIYDLIAQLKAAGYLLSDEEMRNEN